jgi:CRP/FNR family transcriptional regulator
MMESDSFERCDFLAQLSAPERALLLRGATRREVEREALIFQAGSPGSHIYFLECGRAKVYHLSPAGKEILLWFCLPGEVFGLAEACQGGGRQVYAQACERSSVLAVRQQEFRRFLEQFPTAALLVNEVLACRLRSLGRVIQGLVTSDVNERVRQLLGRLAASYGRREENGDVCLTLHITHQEMANMIGSTRQSVTSALNALRRAGVVDIERRRLVLRAAVDTRPLVSVAMADAGCG